MMVTASLLVAGGVSILTGLAYGYVAFKVARRRLSADAHTANLTLALWWGLLGAYLLIQGALTVLAGLDALTFGAYLASRVIIIPLLCGSVAALIHHMTYLYTGNAPRSAALAAIYIPIAILFAYATFAQPQELRISPWLISLDDSSLVYRLVYILVGVPPILACVAYYALLRRVREPVLRFRIRLVSISIGLYIAGGLAARLTAGDAVKFVTLVGFGSAAAALVLLAYRPPDAIRERLRSARLPSEAKEDFMRRVRELV